MQLKQITAKRTDPTTGITYTFSSTAADFVVGPPGSFMTEKQYAIMIFWWADSQDLSKQAAAMIGKTGDLLPILNWCVQGISTTPNAESADDSSETKFDYDICYCTHPETSPDPEIAQPPSQEMMVMLINEITSSDAFSISLFLYFKYYRPQLEAFAKEERIERDIKRNIAGSEAITSKSKQIDLKKNIVQNIHSLTQQFYVGPGSTSASESATQWSEFFGQEVGASSIKTYGIDLTEIQSRVMEGLIYALSSTNYVGNLTPISKVDLLRQYDEDKVSSIDSLPKMYQHVKQIPKIAIGRRELVKLSGMNDNNGRDVERVGLALEYLTTTQFCFYYTRLVIGKNGKPERDKNGDNLKESVTSVDTLFKLKVIRDETSQVFKHYEISPSALFLDQKEKYFMLIPYGWREEVRELVGNKKASAYLYLFLLYLRYQFEQKRRYNAKRGIKKRMLYEIKGSWVSIAQALRMPESVYKRKPDRAISFLDNAYSAAKQLGYLTTYSRIGITDTLVLNPEKYPTPREVSS